jgi:twinkle protein
MEAFEQEPQVDYEFTPLPTVFRGIPDRKLTKETVTKYNIGVYNGTSTYPYFDDSRTNHRGNKIRNLPKSFVWEGDPKGLGLFGSQLFEPGSAKTLTITEGELDAAAAFQMQGSRYPVVSVRSAGQALSDCRNNFEYINSFQNVVLNFDNDPPGQEAALKCAKLFPIGKVRNLVLKDGKDACDYLMKDLGQGYLREWWAAPAFTPAGLKIGKNMYDEITNRPQLFSVPYPWDGLNTMTFGIRLSELVLLTADTGVGKTSVFKEIEHSLLVNKGLEESKMGVGFLHLEEPNHDTALGLMSIHNNKPYHLPDTERVPDELRLAFDACINNDRVVVWDHFGSNDIEEVLSKIRHMVALGCRYIFLDHLSIIVSSQDGDERKQLDEISTKLKMLTMELGVAVMAVIHTNRQGQVRGSAGPEQVANIVLQLYRDKDEMDKWRRNVLKISVRKNRFSGRTGPACWMHYSEETGRLKELSNEDAAMYENAGTKKEEGVW